MVAASTHERDFSAQGILGAPLRIRTSSQGCFISNLPHGGIGEGSGLPFPSAYTELFEPTKIAGFAESRTKTSTVSHTTNRSWLCDGWACVTFSLPVTRLDILIQAEKVARIILCLDRDHLLPTSLVGFRDAVLLVATHEIHVDAGFHGRP
jgi:hypothetical protein